MVTTTMVAVVTNQIGLQRSRLPHSLGEGTKVVAIGHYAAEPSRLFRRYGGIAPGNALTHGLKADSFIAQGPCGFASDICPAVSPTPKTHDAPFRLVRSENIFRGAKPSEFHSTETA